ncbi:hypothetical protein P4C99_12075 [Pontiellaceae bacterium B1224]|nr:hypothetical protein [Pontiellaceae bacterium B1224]
MMFKQQTNAALYISALAGVLTLFIVSGCKSPPAKDTAGSDSTQVDAGSDSVANAPAEKSTVTETPQKTVIKKGEVKTVEAEVVVVQTGPGDGPPPAEDTKKAVKKMEQSLAPLEAVPAMPTS